MKQAFGKITLAGLCLVPSLWLGVGMYNGTLGANPVEKMLHVTGDWTLNLLLVTLAVTPLVRLTGWKTLGQLRRQLGLFAFVYAIAHVCIYVGLDKMFSWPDILKDTVRHQRIYFGLAAFLLMLPLAATSSDRMIRFLQGRRWKMLHRFVYVASLFGVIHYLLLVKQDLRTPLWYAGVYVLLMAFRIIDLHGGKHDIDRRSI